MKTLNVVEKYTGSHGQINEIIEHNGSKFKIVAILTNGTDRLYTEKMDSDGIFQNILGMNDVNFQYTASYVSDKNRKEADLKTGIDKMKALIKKVY
jgi:hypothetical protein